MHLIDALLHLDTYLIALATNYGNWMYLILFMVIFCETGLVVTPFLPGDSLLFATGSFIAQPTSGFNGTSLFFLLIFASFLGNQVNYYLGYWVGPFFFDSKRLWLLNKKHLQEAHAFYEKNGGKTIIMARFLPIIRTFAPFVAGLSKMNLALFSFYNGLSAILWVGSLLGIGYFFGAIPFIKNNFTTVIYGIIVLSLTPPLLSFISNMRAKNQHKAK